MSSPYTNGHDAEAVGAEWVHPGPDAADTAGADEPPWDDVPPHGEAGAGDDGAAEEEVRRFDALPDEPPLPPIARFVAQGHGSVTVLFGDGGEGKGTLAAKLVAEHTQQGGSALIIDAEGHPGEWGRRLRRFGADMTRGAYWAWSRTVPLREAVDDYRGTFDFVVVDSAAYFPGSQDDQWGPSAAIAMQDAAKAMRIPLLVIAHVAKHSPQGKAYGSGFWHNVPRVSMEIEASVVTCRKATDVKGLKRGMRFDVTPHYADDDLFMVEPTDVTITPHEGGPIKTLVEQLREVMGEDEYSLTVLATTMGWSESKTREVLRDAHATYREQRTAQGGRKRLWRLPHEL